MLKGRFTADVESCNRCAVNGLGWMISRFVLVYFIPTLFGKGTLEASTLKEFHSSSWQARSQITNH